MDTIDKDQGHPLPTTLMTPWIDDNTAFVSGLQERNDQLQGLEIKLRDQLEAAGPIKQASEAEPTFLAAVDAGEDQVSILMQTDFARTISGPQGDLRSLSAGSSIGAGRIHPAGILDQEYIRQIWLNSFAISMPKPSTSSPTWYVRFMT